MMKRQVLAVVVGFIFASLSGCSDAQDNGSIGADEQAELFASPSTVTFSKIRVGETATQTLEIQSVGSAPLRIKSVALEETDEGEATELQKGQQWFSEATIDAGEKRQLTVKYTPKEKIASLGEITIQSNASGGDAGRHTIPVETPTLEPLITSRPRLIFSNLSPGQTKTKSLNVRNAGQASLTFDDIYLETQGTPFTIGEESASEPEAIGETLAPGKSIDVDINYNPTAPERHQNKIVFATNAANTSKYSVKLVGRQDEPCLQVSKTSPVEFDETAVGRNKDKVFVLTNCGNEDVLKIQNIEMTSGADGGFSILEESLPDGMPDEPAEIPPDGRATFKVRFKPDAEESFNGELKLESNDPINQQKTFELNGSGVELCVDEDPEFNLTTGYDDDAGQLMEPTSPEQKVFDDDWIVVTPAGENADYEDGPAKVMPGLLWDCQGGQRQAVNWAPSQGYLNGARWITFREGMLTSRDCNRKITAGGLRISSTRINIHSTFPTCRERGNSICRHWLTMESSKLPLMVRLSSRPRIDEIRSRRSLSRSISRLSTLGGPIRSGYCSRTTVVTGPGLPPKER